MHDALAYVNVDTKCRQLNSVIVIIGSFTVNQSGMDMECAATLLVRFIHIHDLVNCHLCVIPVYMRILRWGVGEGRGKSGLRLREMEGIDETDPISPLEIVEEEETQVSKIARFSITH